MVRRAAATSLSAIVKNVSRETLEHKLMPSFIQIASDDQDSVRLLSLDILLALAGAVNKDTEFLETHLFPILKNLFEDHSWRVHYVLAEKFSMIATQIYPCSKETPVDSSIDWAAELLLRFVKLLNDEEGEVRTIACKSLAQVCPLFVPLDVQKHVLPALRLLSSDRSDFVRSRLALEISEISGAVDKDSVIRSLLPILVSLLKDENSEVRLNVISKLEKMNQVIGIELLSQYLLPAIVELSNDTQWRVRLAIVEHMPLLAEQLGPEFFNGSLKDLCLAFLGDSVYAVRMATVNSLGSIMNTYGATWAKAEIFPQMMAQSEQVHYLYRLMTLFSINYFVPLLDIVSSKEFFIPVLKRLVTDKVPNIRLNVAKTIAIMAKTLIEKDLSQATSMIQSFLLPALTNLQNDPDEDVQYYAQKSIHEIEAL